MTLRDCTKILTPLAITLRAQMDVPQYRAYHRALQDVSPVLLELAVAEAMTCCDFFPKPVELRRLAERARQSILAAHPFTACATCALTPGWAEVMVEGVNRLQRCACHGAWLASLNRLGVGTQPVLTAAVTQNPTETEASAV